VNDKPASVPSHQATGKVAVCLRDAVGTIDRLRLYRRIPLDVCRGCGEDALISSRLAPMAQRILEPGQIETLAQASIPRIRLPAREFVFTRRAARLRRLAAGSALGDYLQFLAVLVDAQHAALADFGGAAAVCSAD